MRYQCCMLVYARVFVSSGLLACSRDAESALKDYVERFSLRDGDIFPYRNFSQRFPFARYTHVIFNRILAHSLIHNFYNVGIFIKFYVIYRVLSLL